MKKPFMTFAVITILSSGVLSMGLTTVAFANRHAVANGSTAFVATHSQTFTEAKAIAEVNIILGTAFPKVPTTTREQIWVGGPTPHLIPATLQTQTQTVSSNVYLVTFTEKWSSKDFHGMGSSNKGMLEHHWTYKVSPNGSSTVSNGGDFPPQVVK